MSILLGDEPASSGQARIAGKSRVDYNKLSCGYNPQFDSFADNLTLKEHIELVASLKGARGADQLTSALGLDEFAGTPVNKLSGGNKRKLTLALTLLGSPETLILDEPSTGVDPKSRRQLWNVLLTCPQAMLLSTHLMEEAEALSTKIVIQIRGRVRAVGSAAELVSRFCTHVRVFFQSPCPDSGDRLLAALPAGSTLVTEGGGMRELQVPLGGATVCHLLAEAFRAVESLKEELQIKQYSIAMTTLEQVFMGLVRQADAEADADQSAVTGAQAPAPQTLGAAATGDKAATAHSGGLGEP